MTFKQRVLSALSKEALLDLGRHFGVDVKSSMTVDQLVARLGSSKRATLDKLLPLYPKDRLTRLVALAGDGVGRQSGASAR